MEDLVRQLFRSAPLGAIDHREFLRNYGIRFTYLLNAPFRFSDDSTARSELDQYLDWILQQLQPDSLMVSSLDLMHYIRERGSDIPIHISTIAGVKTVDDLRQYLEVKPHRLVVHHDLGKEWPMLKKLLDFCREQGIEGEMLVTESCLYRCANRKAHYEYLARKTKDSPFHTCCNAMKLIHPREFLMAGGVVRPEDIALLENMGIRHIKISGRSKPAHWLPEVVNAYLNRAYEGNLIRLLGIDPSMHAEEWICLNNQALEGFLPNYPHNGDYSERVSYCEEWIVKLYRAGDFGLSDGSVYNVTDGSLVLEDSGGEKAKAIISKEIDADKQKEESSKR